MKVVLIDSFDSFVYIIDEYMRSLGAQTAVLRANTVSFDELDAMRADALVLGPGPGHPADTIYPGVIERFASRVPILGVCLGHQSIGVAFGCEVDVLAAPRHGKTSLVTHDGQGCFAGLPQLMRVTRYHSLHVRMPPTFHGLKVTATSKDDSTVMGIRHQSWPLEGIQFHPESIMTDQGINMISNFLSNAAAFHDRTNPDLQNAARAVAASTR